MYHVSRKKNILEVFLRFLLIILRNDDAPVGF